MLDGARGVSGREPDHHMILHEGQPRLPAHAARALEREVAVLARAEVHAHALRPEHRLRLPLPLQIARRAAVVEDAGEVRVEDDVLQIRDDHLLLKRWKAPAVQDAHDLVEQGAVVLLVRAVVFQLLSIINWPQGANFLFLF